MERPEKLVGLAREILNTAADKIELIVPTAEVARVEFNYFGRGDGEPLQPTTLFPHYIVETGDTPAEAILAVLNTALPLVQGRTVYWRRLLEMRCEVDRDRWEAFVRFSAAPLTDEERTALARDEEYRRAAG